MNQENEEIVRRNTPDAFNEAIDQAIRRSLRLATNNPKKINDRLTELEGEWDVERTLELNASTLALTGVVLAATVHKRWLILPAVVTFFLAQHAIQGWCPPLPLIRKLGIRTRSEIDREKYALKMLRGDFGQKVTDADQAWEAVKRS